VRLHCQLLRHGLQEVFVLLFKNLPYCFAFFIDKYKMVILLQDTFSKFYKFAVSAYCKIFLNFFKLNLKAEFQLLILNLIRDFYILVVLQKS